MIPTTVALNESFNESYFDVNMALSKWTNDDTSNGDADCILDCPCEQHVSTFVPLEFLVERQNENDTNSYRKDDETALNDDCGDESDEDSQAEFSSGDSTRVQWDAWKTPEELLAEEREREENSTSSENKVPKSIQYHETSEIDGVDEFSVDSFERKVQDSKIFVGQTQSFESSVGRKGSGHIDDGSDIGSDNTSDSDQFRPKSFSRNVGHIVDTSSEEDCSRKSFSPFVIDLVSSSDEEQTKTQKANKSDNLRPSSSPKVIDLISSDENEAESVSQIDGSDDSSRITTSRKISPGKENSSTPAFPRNSRSSRTKRPTIYDSSSDEDEANDEWSESNDMGSFFVEDSDEEAADDVARLVDLTNQINIQDTVTTSKRRTSCKPQKPNSISFKRNREALSQQLFQSFDQKAFQGRLGQKKTSVTWSNKLRTTAGMTRLRTKNGCYSAAIELSTKVLDDFEKMEKTLLHEMCHAAAFLIDNVARPPHGKCFWKWANHATSRTSIEVSTCHSYEIAFKYAWACTSKSCNVVIKRHSRSVNVEKHVCGRCKSKLIEVEVTSKGDTSLTPRAPWKKAPPNQYNQFIKSNCAKVREQLERDVERGKVAQAEVMKECARLWRERQNAKPE